MIYFLTQIVWAIESFFKLTLCPCSKNCSFGRLLHFLLWHFLIPQDAPGTSSLSPAPSQESIPSWWSPGSFYWRTTIWGPDALTAIVVALFLGPVSRQSQEIPVCILNHVYTQKSLVLYLSSCIRAKGHEFVLITLISGQHHRFHFSLPFFLICNVFLQQLGEKTSFLSTLLFIVFII